MIRALLTCVWMVAWASGLAAAGEPAADVPARSESGQALAVPAEQLDLGDVYYLWPGEDTQLLCTSDAPLQRLVISSSRIVGYVVTPFDLEAGKSPLLAGAFRVPVAALSTGLAPMDDLLRGPAGLNAAEYAELTFLITRTSEPKLVSDEKGRKSYTLKIAGTLKIKDKAVELEFPAHVALIPFTWQTMGRNVGELLTLRAKLDLKLADLGLQKPDPTFKERIADVLNVDLFLLANTISPEKNFDPGVNRAHFLKQLQFVTLLRDFNDPQKGYEFGRAFMREIWGDAQALNRLALATLTEDGIQTRDLSFALKAAQRANELTGSKDPVLLGTLARGYYQKADLPEAIKWVRQAAEHLDGAPPPVAAEIRATLQRYEAEAGKGQE
jgi:hypothetical protein